MTPRYQTSIGPEASSDLDSIFQYILRDSPQNAESVLDELLDTIRSLNLFPERYPVFRRGNRSAGPIRIMPVHSYLVYYRVMEADHVVRILTVRHARRRRPRSL